MKYFTVNIGERNVALDCYLFSDSPDMPNCEKRPAVLIFPGGGYYMLCEREAEPIALAYLGRGYNAFILRYTAGQGISFDMPFGDAQEAIKYIREHAEELRLADGKLACLGFSAGGHLASACGTMGPNRPDAMILCYPVIHDDIGETMSCEFPETDALVDDMTPPAFIFTTQGDTLVPCEHSLAFAMAMAKAERPYELHVFLSGDHGLALAEPSTCFGYDFGIQPVTAQWHRMSVDWLRALWGDYAPADKPTYVKPVKPSFFEQQ